MSKAKEKQCVRCELVKVHSEFHRDKSTRDGLTYYCKACRKIQSSDQGIENWDQVGDVIRKLAELQFAIDAEKAVCQKRIALIQKYSDEATVAWESDVLSLRSLIELFLKRICVKQKTVSKDFRFGSVRFFRGRIYLELDTILAGKKRGKP